MSTSAIASPLPDLRRPTRSSRGSLECGGGGVDDPAWFDELYRQSYRRLVLIALSITRNLGDAEEVVQEAFARGYARRRTLEGVDNPEAWLTTVALNVARRRMRRRTFGAGLAGPGPDDANPVDRRISNLDLFDAILRLPEQQREAVVLHHLADLPLEEIARRLGVAVGTLKSRLARGRSTLADLLGDERPFPEGAQP
jgi:RNA polymerase sigma-70 factor (sigma-E family)